MTTPAWLRTVLLLGITFAAGAMGGIGYERHRHTGPLGAVPDAHHVMHHLQTELKLDSAQHEAIAAILARHQGAIDSTWRRPPRR